MKMSRRDLMQSAAATLLAGAAGGQPANPPAAPRLPLSTFLKSDRLLRALRNGVAAMKQRKAYDPLSWFYQASIHGVLPEVVQAEREKLLKEGGEEEAGKLDAVFQKRYWNQCPHNGEEAANFLPWHRGYTYHFEKILRWHTKEDDFSLPFWDYEPKENRKFPRAFGEAFIGGDRKQPNPLFLAERDLDRKSVV